ncbi:MAG: glycoside hydrolase family 52 protein, partial [Planctomycetota bacterium]
MSWTVARLGSRFSLLFEPQHRRVMHSAMGRFLDAPLDLSVGLVEPDGVERVLPFTERVDRDFVEPLYNCEQFDRINSVTFRGYSAAYRLRFEFNVHSVFYPQNRRLCLTPAMYLEMRVNAVDNVRDIPSAGPTPEQIKLRLRIGRADTKIVASPGRIELAYANPLEPRHGLERNDLAPPEDFADVQVRERIVSLNPDAAPLDEEDGRLGLELNLPVTEAASGVKWRLVWGAHVDQPVLRVRREGRTCPAKFAYTDYYPDLDAVLTEAVQRRDEYLALSRRFEKIIEKAPLDLAQNHLLNLSFQNYLANTFWCTGLDESEVDPEDGPLRFPWFSVWEGSSLYQSTIDVEYNAAMFALTLWPDLLKLQLQQWPQFARPHE